MGLNRVDNKVERGFIGFRRRLKGHRVEKRVEQGLTGLNTRLNRAYLSFE